MNQISGGNKLNMDVEMKSRRYLTLYLKLVRPDPENLQTSCMLDIMEIYFRLINENFFAPSSTLDGFIGSR